MEENEKLPLYILGLDDLDFDGITAISLVDFPAIEENFIKLAKASKRNDYLFGKTDTLKHIVTGPALIPDKKIYRADMFRGEFEVMFTSEGIEKIRDYFLQNFKQKDITVDHVINANNISIVESWIIEDKANDKANALGFDLPKGTWMVSMKIENGEVWDRIEDGELKGFSIEAYLSQTLISAAIKEKELNEISDEDEGDVEEVNKILDNLDAALNDPEVDIDEVKKIETEVDALIESIKNAEL